MKISKEKLKQIIKEEMGRIQEADPEDAYPANEALADRVARFFLPLGWVDDESALQAVAAELGLSPEQERAVSTMVYGFDDPDSFKMKATGLRRALKAEIMRKLDLAGGDVQ